MLAGFVAEFRASVVASLGRLYRGAECEIIALQTSALSRYQNRLLGSGILEMCSP